MSVNDIGAPLARKEDHRYVRGAGEYVADIRLPQAQRVAFPGRPSPDTRIRSIGIEDSVRRVFYFGRFRGRPALPECEQATHDEGTACGWEQRLKRAFCLSCARPLLLDLSTCESEKPMDWGGMSRAARDAAYNNGAAVANSAALSQARREASAVYRAAHATALDLPYGTGPRNKWDLYPGTDAAAPCLVFIHGGYWQMNDRESFACLAEGLAAHGWSAALPGYTLAPDASLSAIAAEIRAALDWLTKNGGNHGIAGPIVLSGWSAGGHLTALLLDHPAVTAGFAISGVYEVGPLRDTYINDKLRLTDQEIETLSPLRLPVVGKPLAIAYGTNEVPALVNDSRMLHARRSAAHAPGPLVPVAGADHFTVLHELRSPSGVLVRQARALL